MNDLSATVLTGTLLFLMLWAGLQLLLDALFRMGRRPLRRLEPTRRHRLLMAVVALPILSASVLTGLVFWPWAQEQLVLAHCHQLAGCGGHAPGAPWPAAFVLPLCLSALMAGRMLIRYAAVQDVALRLQALPQSERHAFTELDCNAPLAISQGLRRSRVCISRGLVSQLSASELATVIAHEKAHCQRADNLRRFLASLLAFPGCGRQLQAELNLASEQLADGAAASFTGGAMATANTLIRLQKLALCSVNASYSNIAGGEFGARIQHLVQPPAEPRGAAFWPLMLLLLFGLMIASSLTPAHHLAEWLLRLLG